MRPCSRREERQSSTSRGDSATSAPSRAREPLGGSTCQLPKANGESGAPARAPARRSSASTRATSSATENGFVT